MGLAKQFNSHISRIESLPLDQDEYADELQSIQSIRREGERERERHKQIHGFQN